MLLREEFIFSPQQLVFGGSDELCCGGSVLALKQHLILKFHESKMFPFARLVCCKGLCAWNLWDFSLLCWVQKGPGPAFGTALYLQNKLRSSACQILYHHLVKGSHSSLRSSCLYLKVNGVD